MRPSGRVVEGLPRCRHSPVDVDCVRAWSRPDSHPVRIAYASRWYRLRPNGSPHPVKVRYVAAGYRSLGLAFPSDNRTVGIVIAAALGNPGLPALRDPHVFENVARRFPSTGAWLALEPTPLGGVHVMAGIDNRWTSFVDASGPVVAGLVAVGDALMHTNPTLSQNIAMTLWAARQVALQSDGSGSPEPGHAGFVLEYGAGEPLAGRASRLPSGLGGALRRGVGGAHDSARQGRVHPHSRQRTGGGLKAARNVRARWNTCAALCSIRTRLEHEPCSISQLVLRPLA
jgi:hypothetical protein